MKNNKHDNEEEQEQEEQEQEEQEQEEQEQEEQEQEEQQQESTVIEKPKLSKKEQRIYDASKHIREALKTLGFYKNNNNLKEHMRKTHVRIARAWAEYRVKDVDALNFEPTMFSAEGISSIQIIKGISFSSLCAHHFFPFMGKCHVAYLPDQYIIGLSKIPRLIHFITTQPSTQELLVDSITDKLFELIAPKFVMVVMDNVIHTCCSCRGVRSTNMFLSSSIRSSPELSSEDIFSLKEEVIKLLQI